MRARRARRPASAAGAAALAVAPERSPAARSGDHQAAPARRWPRPLSGQDLGRPAGRRPAQRTPSAWPRPAPCSRRQTRTWVKACSYCSGCRFQSLWWTPTRCSHRPPVATGALLCRWPPVLCQHQVTARHAGVSRLVLRPAAGARHPHFPFADRTHGVNPFFA